MVVKNYIFVITFVFILVGDTREVNSLRLSQKCPLGNYFTDGCVSCWCDSGNGQRVCENMIACPRKNVKCPMGRKYEDECGNECTCYENTGAIFCKEKGPCNSIKKRRNTWQPPLPSATPSPINRRHLENFVDEDEILKVRSHSSHSEFPKNVRGKEHIAIPKPVPLPKMDLIIEPALIIRRKSFKGGDEKKKHPTTLLYLYEKQLKSMKEFNNYYTQYLHSEKNDHENSNKVEFDIRTKRPQLVSPIMKHQESITSMKTFTRPVKMQQPQLEIEIPVRKPEPIYHQNVPKVVHRPYPQQQSNYAKLLREKHQFSSSSTTTQNPIDFGGATRAKENNQMVYRKPNYSTIQDLIKLRLKQQQSLSAQNLSTSTLRKTHQSSFLQDDYAGPSSVKFWDKPKIPVESKSPQVTVYNVVSTPSPFASSSTPKTRKMISNLSTLRNGAKMPSSTLQPQFISYYKNDTGAVSTLPFRNSFTKFPKNATAKDSIASASDHETHIVRAELNKPIFLNHIVATRMHPDIYMGDKFKGKPSRIDGPPPFPPPFQSHRPNRFRLILKSEDKKPLFYSERNRVPLFVDKIAREFFKKPSIFVPKIKKVNGRPQLQLNRVVYNHREMIPKELTLEPGGPPMKIKFTPQANREMDREWVQAIQDKDRAENNHYQEHDQYSAPPAEFSESFPQEVPLGTRYGQSELYPDPEQGIYDASPIPGPPTLEDAPIIYPEYPVHSPTNLPDEALPFPDPIPEPPFENHYQHPSDIFSTDTNNFHFDSNHAFSSVSERPYSVPVIDHPPPMNQDSEVHIMEHVTETGQDGYPQNPPVTEPESDYHPVSPRPETDSEFAIPQDYMDNFGQDDPWVSPQSPMLDSLAMPSEHSDHDEAEQDVLMIESIKKANGVEQDRPSYLQTHYNSGGNQGPSLDDIFLSHKQGPNHVRIRGEHSFVSSTTQLPPTTTTERVRPSTTEKFDPEKLLREILAMDPDIGPDAVLLKEDGQTIPPLRYMTPTSTTPAPSLPLINIKGDAGFVPQKFEQLVTSTSEPIPEIPTFEQFYLDLFRPQKKREEKKKKPDGFVETEGVAKIFNYGNILESFHMDDEVKSNNPGEPSSLELEEMKKMEKRANNDKSKKKNRPTRKPRKKPKTTTTTTTERPTTTTRTTTSSTTTTPPPKLDSKTDPETSFKKELDWKSGLVSDICSVNPNSALCFTYKSLCMLMGS